MKKRQCRIGAEVCLIINSPTMIVTRAPETRKSAEKIGDVKFFSNFAECKWFDSDYEFHKEYFPYKSLRLAKDWKKKSAESV